MNDNSLLEKIARFTSIEQALDYFEIGYDSKFIDEHRTELVKRFNGYLILEKPDDWFSGRRALKNAYCKVQRGRLDKNTRSACRGCTSCQRR
ncbi:hypothetical protein NM22_02585 [Vibrio tubiashii]|nr:hypothetical protein NM22_02585 [Vibrio tubiashii]